MEKVEGYWNIVPKIKKIVFPVRGKIGVILNVCSFLAQQSLFEPLCI